MLYPCMNKQLFLHTLGRYPVQLNLSCKSVVFRFQIPLQVLPGNDHLCVTNHQGSTTCGASSQPDLIQIYVLLREAIIYIKNDFFVKSPPTPSTFLKSLFFSVHFLAEKKIIFHRVNPTKSDQIVQISPPPIVKHVFAPQNAKKMARELFQRKK